MTPSTDEVTSVIKSDRLDAVLRGELPVFPTPAYVNAQPWPTDHSELLEKGIYPLAPLLGADYLCRKFEVALLAITYDAIGVFTAHQCFFVYVIDESAGKSPFRIDRTTVTNALGEAFLREAPALRDLEARGREVPMELPYSATVAQMRILQRDHGITWQFDLSGLLP